MTTIEDKISLFSKIIYDKVNEEKEGRLKDFRAEAQKRIDVEKEKIEELRRCLQRDVAKKSDIKANGIVAKERLKKQREMLFLKEKLIKEALENVGQKLVEFALLPEYKPYFLSILEKTLKEIDSGDYYIIILKRDYEKFKREIGVVLSNYSDRNVEIKISEEDFIGGIILKDIEGKFKIDNSLYSKLEESKEIIGVRVMEMLA
ncbi:V-type ATP synthase subunit E [Clostridium tagluense]|uniref:V-type ATP synthase subunit E n=1 Tax=Clostridium tagluense TaxID=360422 RepID=UPI001C0AEC2F|nr:V-type ATP synthase subunit E [Clostridium tagluense]MBU3128430.1 V-type ATP synthase subunit E [Clostridium tagluense]MCB2313204.1 V-type ATP synthase subunit E [Clostridium tagluense]MCB2317970.1 V-type ATP synthase subunit E [Clostridium tagluense]MCB2322718.1 V-type ATP synthase subunit E [Clostridium tagluense]MCB2327716.1 V-type ATP synthase subunit E [Clostridium tagluense]